MVSDCLFCRMVSGEIAADKLYEDDDVLAFRDINPQAPQHFLVIPKKHIATINDASESDSQLLGKLLMTAKKIAKEMAVAETGYRLVFNCNEQGGQTVYHIHLHCLAGRQFHWPPG